MFKCFWRIALCNRIFSETALILHQQVLADAEDGTVDQVSISNNGTSAGEDRTIDCVGILFC